MNLQSNALEGQVLAGRYRVGALLGQGGMGMVVAAQHLLLDEPVAIKFLAADALTFESLARFEREARAALKIKSEHVVRVLDVGRLDSGAPYLVMEYLDGEDLGRRLRRLGRLSIEEAVDFVLQTCVAMADAHAIGIVHRDLKPSNLFCVRRSDGRALIKVLDFGISKQQGAETSFGEQLVTRTGAMLGSPLYMSPEQVQGARHVDARSDVWSLGIVLFELLCGTVPFPGEAFGEVAVKIATLDASPMSSYRDDIPVELEQVVARCLKKVESERFPNVAELARALSPFAPREAEVLVERVGRILQVAQTGAATVAAPPPKLPRLTATGTAGEWASTREVPVGKWARGGALLSGVALLGLLTTLVVERCETRVPFESDRALARSGHARVSAASAGDTSATDASARALPLVGPAGMAPSSVSPRELPSVTEPGEGLAASGSTRSSAVRRATPNFGGRLGSAMSAAPLPDAAQRRSDSVGCAPPFVVDALGRKRFKPECFLNAP